MKLEQFNIRTGHFSWLEMAKPYQLVCAIFAHFHIEIEKISKVVSVSGVVHRFGKCLLFYGYQFRYGLDCDNLEHSLSNLEYFVCTLIVSQEATWILSNSVNLIFKNSLEALSREGRCPDN